MLRIDCPWCGAREEIEFSYGGQAHVAYPADPDALTDEQWAQYLFMRDNPKGVFLERWVHTHGCRRWFNAARHTVTHRITATYKPGEAPPQTPALQAPAPQNLMPQTLTPQAPAPQAPAPPGGAAA